MPYVIVQGNSGDRARREALAIELTETVATLFAVPRRSVVVAVIRGDEEIVVSTGGRSYFLDLDVTVEGAGIRRRR